MIVNSYGILLFVNQYIFLKGVLKIQHIKVNYV